ncbi:MAG: hypothetical protein AB7X49_20805 [Geminicoccaceae bacterium]
MTERDTFGERRQTQEDEYFRKREQELIQKMRQRAETDAARRQLAEQSGIADTEVLQDLEALGYTPDTVRLLHLVPLVQMAWAEGGVSDRERSLILDAARAGSIDDGSAAAHQLAQWLATRPTDQFFETTLRAIGALLAGQPAAERDAAQRDLLAHCTAIAAASGGILGRGKVSDTERQLLRHISRELETRRGTTASGSHTAPEDES